MSHLYYLNVRNKSLQPWDRYVTLETIPLELISMASEACIAARVQVALGIGAMLNTPKRGFKNGR